MKTPENEIRIGKTCENPCGHVPKLTGGNRGSTPYARTLCADLFFLLFRAILLYFPIFPVISYYFVKGLGVGPYVWVNFQDDTVDGRKFTSNFPLF